MDNITHTLVGVALGHTLGNQMGGRTDTPREADLRQKFAKAVLWTSIVGSNFPDIDVLMNPFFKNAHLAGLLQHRGYTHSFLALPFFAWLSEGLGAKFAGMRFRATSRLFWVGALAVFLHIAADYLNDYGVHPLSPFLNRWFYGDTLFILEPSIWLAVLPLAFFAASSMVTRTLSLAFEIMILGAIWFSPYAPWVVAAALSVWGAGFFAATGVLRNARARVIPALCGIAVSVLSFFVMGQNVSGQVRDAFARVKAGGGAFGEQIADIVRTPAPGNPSCWRVIAVSSRGDHYIARLGVVNFAAPLIQTDDCFFRVSGERNSVLSDSTLADTATTHWIGEFSASLSELKQLARKDCQMEALLRFARVPFWDAVSAADLRYAYGGKKGFTGIRLGADQTFCLSFVPPWTPPLKLLSD